MDKHEAEMLLSACRPDGQDAEDTAMNTALELMRDDPALAQWFAESQAFDTAIAGHLASVPVPDSLKEDILAGARAARRRSFWRSGWTWLAAAAAVALAFFVSPPVPRHSNKDLASSNTGIKPVATLGEYRSDVGAAFASMSVGGFKPTIGVGSMAEVAHFVEEHHSPIGNAQHPGGLATVKPLACRVIDWRGQKVSIICVGRDGLEAHVFVVDRHAISPAKDVDVKAVATASGYPVAAWEDDQHAYVMVGNTKTTDLKKLL